MAASLKGLFQVPVGAGLGLAKKYRGDGHVAFALYGDGAANQGQVYEVGLHPHVWSLSKLPELLSLCHLLWTYCDLSKQLSGTASAVRALLKCTGPK
jgi:hypothetical protein